MVKVGIIGLGFMGLTHFRAFRENRRVKLVAVADQIKERLTGDLSGVQGNIGEAGDALDFSGLRTYEKVGDLLSDPDVELVSICLPTFFHAEVTREALKSGKHVLCEKPMGLTEEEVDSMVQAGRSSNRRLMVAQCIRFWPDYRKAREIVRSRALGSVVAARFSRRSATPVWGAWLGDESKSGGAIVDLSVHDIDFALHLLGFPEKVRADGGSDASRGFDHHQSTLYMNGVPVAIDGGWYFRGEYPFSMSFDIFCEEGVLSYDSGQGRPLTLFRQDGATEEPELEAGDGYSGEVDYIVTCIEEDRAPELSPPEESALSVKLALLLKKSRERGGAEMQVPPEWRLSG